MSGLTKDASDRGSEETSSPIWSFATTSIFSSPIIGEHKKRREVCPTGAIWQITPKEKGWVVGVGAQQQSQPVRLGTAFYDRGRCLPWAMATDCIVCEEWCPVSPKAIYVQEAQVIDSEGNTKTLKQPRVDPSRCVGCGACEYACPLQEHPAVYVTSIGESRSPSSQILLK